MKLSILLALAATTPVWAQTPAPKAEAPAVQIKRVQTEAPTAPSIEVIEEVVVPQRAVLVRTQEEKSVQEERGYLGIYMGADQNQVVVAQVAEGSGAANAGLQAGDVILRVDQQDVKNSAALIEALSQYKPGANVAIQAQRGQEQILFMVTLGARPQVAQAAPSPTIEFLEDVTEEVEEEHAREDPHLHGGEVEVLHGRLKALSHDLSELPLTEAQRKELAKQLAELEQGTDSGEGHGMFTWTFESEVGEDITPGFSFDVDCEVEGEAPEGHSWMEVHEGSPSMEWLSHDGDAHGGIRVKVLYDDEDGACCEEGTSCCEEEQECETQSQCCESDDKGCEEGAECEPQGHHPSRMESLFKRFHGVHGEMGHSRRGQAGMMEWKKLHEMHGVSVPQQRANGQRMRWMQPRRAQNMRNMRPMQRMGPRQGMGQNPMLETLQEMRSEMQAMHQELVKLRKEVRSLKGEQAKSAKNKKQAAQKKKAAQKKQKAQKAKKAAMLEVAPHIISKKVLISKDGGTTSEVHILEEGDTGTWIELKQD